MTREYDLDAIHRFACRLAIDAGSYLREQALARATRSPASAYELDLQIKENDADLVTKVDKHAEGLIMDAIRARYPAHKIIGEEAYSAGQEKRFLLDEDPTWIIDPLVPSQSSSPTRDSADCVVVDKDGTVNFVHGFPMCCVSVGFCIDRKPVAGAIFAPILGGLHPTNAQGTLYSAAKGKGSWSTPISFPFSPTSIDPPSPSSSSIPFQHAVPLPYFPPAPLPANAPKSLLFTAEWGKQRKDAPGSNLSKKVDSLWNMAAETGGRGNKGGMVHGVRSLGSAALDMAFVACGSVDIFWEAGCWEWDVCAGAIILLEAGGRFVPSQPASPEDIEGPIPDADLGSRLYLAIRPCSGTPSESAREAQDRVVREVWRRCERMDYVRPT